MSDAIGPASPMMKGHVASIDGLRGLAVFLVFLRHCFPVPGIETGHLGVRIFFVLSGFFITKTLLSHHQKNALNRGEVSRYFFHRASRILPAYGLVLLLGALLSYTPLTQWIGWHLSMLTNIRMVLDSYAPYPTGHLWSVSLQVHFYLLWPLIFWFGGRKWALRAALLMVMGAPMFRFLWLLMTDYPLGARLLLPGCADTLGAGALLALAGEGERLKSALVSKSTCVAGLVLATAVCIIKAMTASGSLGQVVYLILFDLGIWMVTLPVLYALLTREGILSRFLSFKPLVLFGTVSYGFYLFHPFVYHLFQSLVVIPPLLLALATLIGTCALAGLSWILIERPLLKTARP